MNFQPQEHLSRTRPKTPILLFVLTAFACNVTAAQGEQIDRVAASQLVIKAKQNLREERDEAALLNLLKAAKLDPGNPEITLFLGQVYERIGKYDDAEKQFTRAIALDHSGSAYYSRAVLHFSSKKFELATGDLRKLIQLNCNVSQSLRMLAQCCVQMQQFDDALANCNQLIDREPQDSGCYLLRADVLRRMKQYKSAIRDCTRALELRKNSPGVSALYLERGKAYQLSGDQAAAEQDFKRARQTADAVELDLFPGEKRNVHGTNSNH